MSATWAEFEEATGLCIDTYNTFEDSVFLTSDGLITPERRDRIVQQWRDAQRGNKLAGTLKQLIPSYGIRNKVSDRYEQIIIDALKEYDQ